MNILKTFEIFNRESLRLLKERVFNILFVETNDQTQRGMFVNTTKNNGTQVSVVNNKKVYNLLTSAMYKSEKCAKKNHENKIS